MPLSFIYFSKMFFYRNNPSVLVVNFSTRLHMFSDPKKKKRDKGFRNPVNHMPIEITRHIVMKVVEKPHLDFQHC